MAKGRKAEEATMGKRKAAKRAPAKSRVKIGDLAVKQAKSVKGGAGTAAGFIPGAGVISASISK